MHIITYALLFSAAYLVGSFPTGFLVVKKFSGKDIRKEGTGNVGAMNTARATGKWYLFLLVAVIDALKGALAVYLAYAFRNTGYVMETALIATSFGVILGHCYSLYFKVKEGKFSGGKALAPMLGVLWMVDFTHLVIPSFFALIIPILLTGNLFLGQFVVGLTIPVFGFIFAPDHLLLTFLVVIPMLIKQWPRVIPMLQGKEPKWYWGKKK
jgi:glycerol-3-phosphate acyltransferase PlsY